MVDLEFFYDVVCPWAYLGSTQVEAVAARLGVRVRWRPILLGGVLDAVGAADPNASMSPARARLAARDLLRWADWLDVPLASPPAHPRRTVEAMRLCLLAEEGRARVEVTSALFAAYWVEGRDVSSPEVLGEIARAHAIDPAALQGDHARRGLRAATDAAVAAGVFGVPTFVAGDHFAWGVDRLAQLERSLGGDPPPSRPGAAPTSSLAPTSLAFFHDFASPFSYLASTQLPSVVAPFGVAVESVPILLGALFREVGTPDVPMFAMNPTKQAWVGRDLSRWAEDYGVPFRFPRHFPMRSVLPLRVAIAEPRAAEAIYRAAWAEDRRIDTPEALAEVLADAGFDGDDLVRAAESAAVKSALRDNTARAVAAGVCGVPTVEVAREGRKMLLWGQDRLAMLRSVLAGWWPPRG